ncbi:MAG: FAD-dependent oxidoreductase, partial [Clostridia bacterium]|nr:FAD-dependent oxidoreductase [Clostridia bacterium]
EAFERALREQTEREEIPFTGLRADRVYKTGGGYLVTAGEQSFSAKSAILACGVETSGGVKGEKQFLGRGVSYCAVCDGGLYRGKRIAAVLEKKEYEAEAEYLAGFADTVYCACRYPDPAFTHENIVTVPEAPLAVEGDARVKRLVLAGGKSLEVEGVFFLKDAFPPEALVGGLETEGAHVKVGRDMSTNLAGLFAAGDITGTPYQYAKAAGEGLVAAFSARRFLQGGEQ